LTLHRLPAADFSVMIRKRSGGGAAASELHHAARIGTFADKNVAGNLLDVFLSDQTC
jgi:hypothetical protein